MNRPTQLSALALAAACNTYPEVDQYTVLTPDNCVQNAIDAAEDDGYRSWYDLNRQNQTGFAPTEDRMAALGRIYGLEGSTAQIVEVQVNARDNMGAFLSEDERNFRYLAAGFPSRPEIEEGFLEEIQADLDANDYRIINARARSGETYYDAQGGIPSDLPANLVVLTVGADIESVALFDYVDDCRTAVPFTVEASSWGPTLFGVDGSQGTTSSERY